MRKSIVRYGRHQAAFEYRIVVSGLNIPEIGNRLSQLAKINKNKIAIKNDGNDPANITLVIPICSFFDPRFDPKRLPKIAPTMYENVIAGAIRMNELNIFGATWSKTGLLYCLDIPKSKFRKFTR